MLYIRTDMNSVIATGHVMRCLSIADAVKGRGENVVFVLSDESGVPTIRARGFETMVLHSDWRDLRDGSDRFLECVERGDIVLVDSYSESYAFMASVREKAYVIYIDDTNEEIHPVDGLICYAPYYTDFDCENRYPDADLLLGTAYVPLRREFADLGEKDISDTVRSVLVLSGGSDNCQAIPRILEMLSDRAYESVYAVCGRYSAYYDSLRDAYADRENFHILQTAENLKEYMELCDLAVTAGGSTLYELCAVGTPAVSYSFADNQLPNVRTLDRLQVVPYAGDFRYDNVTENLGRELQRLEDRKLRRSFSEKMRQMVDGRGAQRIADAVCAIKKQKY